MGKQTSVTLSFTKKSKKLYKIKVTFYIVQLKPEERKYFYESLYSKLSEKYGKAKHVKRENTDKSISKKLAHYLLSDFSPDFQTWDKDKKNKITLDYIKNFHTMASYNLIYINLPLTHTNKKEISYYLKQKTHESFSKDASRL
ncbi:MAG: hypothetical protein D3924_05835 [Candidatus Electrothrix sp. AR4]|nr:hypothetical protein [Candidatus Electrothrix sp. AR4]